MSGIPELDIRPAADEVSAPHACALLGLCATALFRLDEVLAPRIVRSPAGKLHRLYRRDLIDRISPTISEIRELEERVRAMRSALRDRIRGVA